MLIFIIDIALKSLVTGNSTIYIFHYLYYSKNNIFNIFINSEIVEISNMDITRVNIKMVCNWYIHNITYIIINIHLHTF